MATNWPDWWHWGLELTPHLLKRMTDRGFNETDLRQMLDSASAFRPSCTAGRFIVSSRYNSVTWEVVVEPDEASQQLLVITAYAKDRL